MKPVGAALLLALAGASAEIRYFRYERPILNIPERGGQSCMALDADLFAHAGAAQLADLRLYRDGTETPYTVRTAAPAESSEKTIPPRNLGKRAGQTVFDAEMPEGKYSDLELAITGKDFLATVVVSGSHAEGGSETKLGSYTVFDLSRQKLGRSTVLHLPESDFRFLHFKVAGPLKPENITALSVERLPAAQPKYVTVAESSQSTVKGHDSVFEFGLPAHVPVDRIVFTPGAEPALFSRNASVAVKRANWTPTGSANETEPAEAPPIERNLLRIHSVQDGHRIDEERLEIDTPGVDVGVPSKWTVTIDNGDDAPLSMKSVRLEMLERSLCFEAQGDAHYTLYYGDPVLAAPRYDYGTLFTPRADAVKVAAGAEVANAAYQPRPDERPFTEKHPGLLWAALVGVIALLGGIALRTARQGKDKPQ